MIGQTLSHYRVTAALGAGGMGEVYRATDSNLGRDVAIKVLPPEVAQDPERLARFQREAKLLASLNHPHIAAIYGLEEADGKPFLALELVEGEDLSERLKRGRVPVEEALDVARQIAEALEAAHEKGIVHRDLKPGNIKLTPDGQVKVLDFGLAKAWTGDGGTGSSADLSQSPTLAHTGTAAGLILGTAAYMSPEQASGRPVDKRADIWAFGVVLFEMLAGERLFAGDNVSEILASVLKEDPAWNRLPADTPRTLNRLLKRCLRKKPRERLHDIADARLEIEEARQELASGPDESGRAATGGKGAHGAWLAWGLAALLAVVSAGLAVAWLSSRSPPPHPLLLSVPLAPVELSARFAVSPDGSQVAFAGRDGQSEALLYVRDLGEPTARAFPGSEGAATPFFSPDGQWIAFTDGVSILKKVPTSGGPVVKLAEGNFRDFIGTWTEDGWILLCQPLTERPGELLRVSADGGPLEPLPTTDEGAREPVVSVSAIPGSPVLLLTVGPWAAPGEQAVALQSLETGERRVVAPGGSMPRYIAGGHVVYQHSGGLMAQRLDARGLKLLGSPIPLQAVTGEGNIVRFDVSPGGTLVFLTRPDDEPPAHLARTARDGRTTPLLGERTPGGDDPRLSPDGRHLAFNRDNDVWVVALERGTLTRISSAPGEDETGVWSPDGQWIAWAGSRPGERRALFRRRSDGSGPEERLWSDERHFHAKSWTAAGIVVTVADPKTGWDVLLVDPEDPHDARPVLNGKFNELSACVSSDGRLLAFVSDETGRNEVYVQSFPEPGGKVQVSLDGGLQPAWRPGTREIVYRGSGKIMSAILGPEGSPTPSAPRPLFDDRLSSTDADHTVFAVERDGSLLAAELPNRPPVEHLRIALDWTETLDR